MRVPYSLIVVDREEISLTRLLLLWTGGLSLCAVGLRDEVFALPVALLVSVTTCVAVMCGRLNVRVWWVYGRVVALAFLGVAFAQVWLFTHLHLDGPWITALLAGYALLGCTVALTQWRGRWCYGAFLVVHVLLVLVLIRNVSVVADVQALLDGGSAALLRGDDPYAITVPGVYGPEHDWIYGPGVLVDDRIMYGYPYLPVPLLFVLPAYVLGDVRLALVLASVLASLLIRYVANDPLGRLAAVLILVMPVSWAMHLKYWVEPVLVLVVAACAVQMHRGRGGALLWFGCFLASKQYAIVHLPYLWLLVRAYGRRAALVALAVPAVLCLVFLVWDPGAFWHSAVEFHLRQPYRYDTVTLTPALERLLGSSPDFLFGPYGLVLGGLVSALISWRCQPRAATLAAGIGLSLAVAVLFSKQGHPNYWGLIGGSLLIAVATSSERLVSPALSPAGSQAPARGRAVRGTDRRR